MMIDNFNFLFQYFEKENSTIVKKEFECNDGLFQIIPRFINLSRV